MLGRLLKHEFKITSRYLVPMYIAIAVATILLKLTFVFSDNSIFMSMEANTVISILQGLLITVYIIVLVGTCILTMFFLIRRFYTNMFGDEGYLTHTLPVTGSQLLNSKLICSFVWTLALIPISIVSFLILFAGTDTFYQVSYYGSIIMDEIYILNVSGFSIGLIAAELIILILTSIIGSLLSYYLCITLGQHFMGDHRLLGSILAYFALSIISSAVSSVFTNVIHLMSDSTMAVTATTEVFNLVAIIFGIGILINLIVAVIYYVITNYLLTKKLNLY